MKASQKKSSNALRSPFKNLPIIILLMAIAALTVFPLLWLISTAFKSPSENIFQAVPQLLPMQPTFENFIKVWQNSRFDLYLWNSFFVSSITVILNLLFCSLAAFPLARMQFKGRDPIFWAIVGTTMIPFQITMIPLYILAVQLKLQNSYFGLIFPYIISAFGIFLLRQAFQSVPKEMEEAARMDGCSSMGIWWYVMLPAARPALITLAVFTFVAMWGDFLWPLVIVDNPQLYTLPRGIASLASTFSEDWRLIAAGSAISLIPVFLVFVFLQRYVIATDASIGVKG